MNKNITYFCREYNDIDHVAPIADELLNNSDINSLCFFNYNLNKSFRDDYRICYLKRHDNFSYIDYYNVLNNKKKFFLSLISKLQKIHHYFHKVKSDYINNIYKKTVKKNILGTTLLLDACKDEGVERFLFASSIYVYSELGSFYRTSKQACELLIENYNELYSLDYTILRYGSLYGSRANDFNFIKNAITQGLIEGKIDRKGTGEEVRDYIHVIDAAKASVQLLSEKYINSNIMIKGQQTIRVSELLSMINEILGNEIEIKYSKEQTYEGHYKLTPYSFRPKVAEKLLLETYQDLGQGLLDTIYDIYNDIYKKSPEKLNSSFKIQTDKNNN